MRIRWEALPVYSRPERTPLYGSVLLPPLGPDRIRVKLEDEHAYSRTLDELKQSLNIRWEQDSDVSWLYDPDGPSKVIKTDRKAVRGENNRHEDDTIIYYTHGTADTADDQIVMIIEDFSDPLTAQMFEFY